MIHIILDINYIWRRVYCILSSGEHCPGQGGAIERGLPSFVARLPLSKSKRRTVSPGEIEAATIVLVTSTPTRTPVAGPQMKKYI